MSRARGRRASGFSLVELMISLALFGLIASGALGLVMSGARNQAHSARVDVAQSGLRAGLDFMTRDILSAGTGCKNSLVLGKTGATLQVITWSDAATNGTDKLEIYTIDGTVQTSNGPVTLTVGAVTGGSSYTVNDATPFKAGDLVMLTDLNNGVLMNVSTASGTTLTSTFANTFATGVSYTANGSAMFLKVRHVIYSVAPTEYGNATTSSTGTALMVDLNDGNGPQPLAEGVEDLQVALGIDTNLDGQIAVENSSGVNLDEWIGNFAGETQPLSLVNLKVIRITLMASSTTKERGTFPARPAAEDHAAGTADGFFRRVVRSQVALRNFNI